MLIINSVINDVMKRIIPINRIVHIYVVAAVVRVPLVSRDRALTLLTWCRPSSCVATVRRDVADR